MLSVAHRREAKPATRRGTATAVRGVPPHVDGARGGECRKGILV